MSSTNHELNSEQIEELKEAFSLFDVNGSGYIAQNELGVTMRSLGCNPTQEELEKIFQQVDDEEKRISFPKFVEIMTVFFEKNGDQDEIDEELMKCFQEFKPNSEGLVSLNSIRKHFQELGKSLVSPKDPDFDPLLYKNWDEEEDKYIDFEAFKKEFGFTS